MKAEGESIDKEIRELKQKMRKEIRELNLKLIFGCVPISDKEFLNRLFKDLKEIRKEKGLKYAVEYARAKANLRFSFVHDTYRLETGKPLKTYKLNEDLFWRMFWRRIKPYEDELSSYGMFIPVDPEIYNENGKVIGCTMKKWIPEGVLG